MPATAPVGADIESLCSKCGDVWHVVVAKVGERIVKVLCKQCQGQHRYKPPGDQATVRAPAAAPRTRSPKAPSSRTARVAEPSVAADLTRPVRPYRGGDNFTVGDRIAHPSFGTGVVQSSPGAGKVLVFFPSTGPKILAMAREESHLAPPPLRKNESD